MRRLRHSAVMLVTLSVLASGAVAGCAAPGAHPGDAAPAPTAPVAATVPMGSMVMPTADEVTAAWSARPEYVRALPSDWQGAYSYALARPDVLQWLPCYCGCSGAGHRSNLDCFFQRRETGVITFEEHASFCDICVQTANLAQQLLREGKTITQVRAAVGATFGGSAPGTDTPLPPSS
jgi:Protein of unknown function with PCYCGC motif